jgi:hypothetical protein
MALQQLIKRCFFFFQTVCLACCSIHHGNQEKKEGRSQLAPSVEH